MYIVAVEDMEAFDCIATKLDIREYSNEDVPEHTMSNILEAARLTGTGLNTQHWRFVLVKDKDNLKKLAEDSTSGKWVSGANFAIIVLTDPKYGFHMMDAGRVLQNMQLAAWDQGIGSGLFTGVKEEKLRDNFAIPMDLNPSVIVGFGYPARRLTGKRKNRLQRDDLVFYEKYGRANKQV